MEKYKKALTIDGDNLVKVKELNAESEARRASLNATAKVFEDRMRPIQEAFNRVAKEATLITKPLNEDFLAAEKAFWDGLFTMYPDINRDIPHKLDRSALALAKCDHVELEYMVMPEPVEPDANVVSLNADKVSDAVKEKVGA